MGSLYAFEDVVIQHVSLVFFLHAVYRLLLLLLSIHRSLSLLILLSLLFSSFLHLEHQPSHLDSSSPSSLSSPESSSSSSSLPLSLFFPLVKADEECLFLPPRLHLSVIIPAYNEALRLPSALCELIYHLESRRASSTENSSLSSSYQTFLGLPANTLHSLSASLERNEGKGNAICSSLSSPLSSAFLDSRQNHSLPSSTSNSHISQDKKKDLSVSSSEEGKLLIRSREKSDETAVEHQSGDARFIFEYEILIVDDGSQDHTSQIGPLLASAIYSPSSSPSASQAAEAALHALDAIRSSSSTSWAGQVFPLSSSSLYTGDSQDGFQSSEGKEERKRKGEERKGESSSLGLKSRKNERSSHETPMNDTGRIEGKERKKSASSSSFFSLNHQSRRERNERDSAPLKTSHSNPSTQGDTSSPAFQAVRAATFYHLQHSSSYSSSSTNKNEGGRKGGSLPQRSREELSQKDLQSNKTRTDKREEGQGSHPLEGSEDRISCSSMDTISNSTHSSLHHILHQPSSSVPATSPSCIRVIRLRENKGKGFAVKTGVRFARGEVILMADADGATNVKDLEALERSLENLLSRGQHEVQIQRRRKKISKRTEEGEGEEEGKNKGAEIPVKPDASSSCERTRENQRQGEKEGREDEEDRREEWRIPVGVAFGSRRHLEAQAVVSRAWYRNFLMHSFHWCVACVVGRGGGREDEGREERREGKDRSYYHYYIKVSFHENQSPLFSKVDEIGVSNHTRAPGKA